MKRALFVILCTLLFGCKVHRSIDVCHPRTCIPTSYSDSSGRKEVGKWWEEYQLLELNQTVEIALANNLDLKQSWWKVMQACAEARIQGAARYPSIDLAASATRFKNSGFGLAGGSSGGGLSGFSGAGSAVEIYQLAGVLNYEVDLWRRVDSTAQAACMEMYATREDLDAVALTLTGTVVDLWFTIQEKMKLLEVIQSQVELSKTLLELVELRFSLGDSSALDVYQQRLQLAATESEIPPIRSELETSLNQLRVLLGQVPESRCFTVDLAQFTLPPFPDIGKPVDLLVNRPDLRAIQRRLLSADYSIAAAVAECYPRLNFSLSEGFQASRIKDLFDFELYRIVGDLLAPIFDAGKRRAQVSKQRAILCETLNRYSQTFLTALQEVEDSMTEEKYQKELIREIEEQINLANSNLEEARSRYINGLNDYLTVIAAVQSLQDLERRNVSEKKNLLFIRNKLYRSFSDL